MIAGVPVGKEITHLLPLINTRRKDGSIIVVIGIDAPLLPSQLKQVAKRAALGIARTGGIGHNHSGDIFIAFSTQSPVTNAKGTLQQWNSLPKEQLDNLYQSTIEATEEAIINALIAAETMKGINDNTFYALPHNLLIDILKKHKRIIVKK